ncbi:MAG: purine nucleoside permease, partial [Verrucomicrobiae bacterium]|nr:purine nucleoside permease [Verrucomicrobiae bacterium]
FWVERLPMETEFAFPQGFRAIRANKSLNVIGTVTGVGTARSAATVMALGTDPRFDLTKTYWVIAGVAGADPADCSVGSAVWAEWVIDGDIAHEIDPREMPKDWPTGYTPLRTPTPYFQPRRSDNEGAAFHLKPGLVEWAYQLTKDVELLDNDDLRGMRQLFTGYPKAQKPPFILKGDTMSAMTFWHGKLMTEWANDWTRYWADENANFVTSAMEDTGTMTSLWFLSRAGKVDLDRVMVLRTASNYTMQHPGITAAQSLAGETKEHFSAYVPALDSAYRVGSKVVRKIVENWEDYEQRIPGD